MKRILQYFSFMIAALLLGNAAASAVDQAKVDAKIAIVAAWGKDPTLVALVKEMNATPPVEGKDMTQEAWTRLTIMDPKVRAFQSNKVGEYLKGKKEAWLLEAFVSLADGGKAGFLSKTSNWSHKGKPKHDDPMAGKTWQGKVEFDQSTAVSSIQIAVPVLDGDTPIGSIVVGLDPEKI